MLCLLAQDIRDAWVKFLALQRFFNFGLIRGIKILSKLVCKICVKMGWLLEPCVPAIGTLHVAARVRDHRVVNFVLRPAIWTYQPHSATRSFAQLSAHAFALCAGCISPIGVFKPFASAVSRLSLHEATGICVQPIAKPARNRKKLIPKRLLC